MLTVIAQIEPVEAKEAVSDIGRTPTLETAKKVETIKAVTETEKIEEAEKRYSPLVTRLAKEYNINLEEIKGTGEGGRVTKKILWIMWLRNLVFPYLLQQRQKRRF